MISNDFATESIMLDHGFTSRLLAGLVSTELAMLYRAPLNVGKKRVQVTYVMITDAGRRALKATAAVPRHRRVSSPHGRCPGLDQGPQSRQRRRASVAKIGTDDPGV
jgi:hypothetical protein